MKIMLILLLGTATLCAANGGALATELGVEGTRFTINRVPTFLVGISYYGALSASKEFITRDLEDMKRYGLNWLRVWATWAAFGYDASVVETETGKPRAEWLAKLKWLVAECDRRGLVVDVTLTRGNGGTGPSSLQTLEAHRQAVQVIVTALKPYRNWYLDLSNERNITDPRFTSFEDLRQLRQEVKRLDSRRLVTASHGGELGRDDLRKYLQVAEVDFLTPHLSRGADSPAKTEARSRQVLEWMKEIGRVVPLHYQEPFRRGYADWQPKASDFLTDVKGAQTGGAAGWCLHNGAEKTGTESKPRRSFDMREKRLFDQLDAEERKALEQLRLFFAKP